MTTDAARLAAGELLRSLASAYQSAALYPQGHPQRAELAAAAQVHLQTLRHSVTGDPTIFVDHASFYLGTTLLVRESLGLGKLADLLVEAGIESMTFRPTATADDLGALVEVLRAERPRTDVGGLHLNAVRSARTADSSWLNELVDLRRAYSAGVHVLRDSSTRAAAGDPIDLDGATMVVSQIADEVAREPDYGLLLSAVKSYDEYTYFHMVNVCLMSVALGQLIGLRRDQVLVLGLGALLHDVGKVFLPTDVLHAAGRLDEEQWRLVQKHPVDGAGLMFATGSGLYHPAAAIVIEHHVGYAEEGYPRLFGHGPSVPSRLVSVVDCYDAVTSKRPYRDPLSRHQALALIRAASGRGLDPDAVRAFERLLGDNPVGSFVLLDSGETGVVTGQRPDLHGQPKILIILDSTGSPAPIEERDLAVTGGRIAQRLDPQGVGVDLTRLIVSGQVHPSSPPPEQGGLVHEPAFGEQPPAGYVDARQYARLEGEPDPSVAPPIRD